MVQLGELLPHAYRKKKGGTRFYLASWQPERPTGFSPCGVAFGALRKAYSARCKFFADDSLYTNRINWYFVPDNAPIYSLPHVFFPRVDQDLAKGPSPFEEAGVGRIVRQKNDGFDLYGLSHLTVDGDEDDFMGRANHDKYMVDGHNPTDPCNGVERCRFHVALFAKRITITHSPLSYAASLALYVEPRPAATMPLALYAGERIIVRVPERKPVAIALALVQQAAIAPIIERGTVGLALASLEPAANIFERLDAGLALAVNQQAGIGPIIERGQMALALTTAYREPNTFEGFDSGLALASTGDAIAPKLERKDSGIALAAVDRPGNVWERFQSGLALTADPRAITAPAPETMIMPLALFVLLTDSHLPCILKEEGTFVLQQTNAKILLE